MDSKPNEWVLILRNREMLKAGVGLRCFRGPFDSVARFPAKVYKVEFKAEQVTNQMSGVTVSGMLVWTINRVGDGPFKALKMLGNIQSGNPTHANESLTKQAVAVVRSCIANSTIDQLITNRKMLRERIKQDMFEQVKGWGVWLETIEITGVQIMSNSLFKNLQANYREKIHQEATLYAMKIKQDVDQQRN